MNYRALKDKLVLKKDLFSASSGGIALPKEMATKYRTTGTVVSIGSDVKLPIKIGDRVLYSRHDTDLPGDLVLLRQNDLIGRLEKPMVVGY